MTELNEEEIKLLNNKISNLTEKEKCLFSLGKFAGPPRIGEYNEPAFILKESNTSFSYRELLHLKINKMI